MRTIWTRIQKPKQIKWPKEIPGAIKKFTVNEFLTEHMMKVPSMKVSINALYQKYEVWAILNKAWRKISKDAFIRYIMNRYRKYNFIMDPENGLYLLGYRYIEQKSYENHDV